MAERCPKCATPLDGSGCVTCAAEAEGLVLLARSAYWEAVRTAAPITGWSAASGLSKPRKALSKAERCAG